MKSEPLNSSDNLVGSVLLGRYRIVRELAKGGMGVVYLARAEGAVGFVKPVVVKLVLPEHASDERYLGMFVREAQILSGLRHPSIVDVIEFGEEAGAYVMVLEYVRGYHLGQWSKYLRKKGRELPTEILLLLMTDVLEALHKAHSMVHPDGTPMHIVHRDVSPSNILLDDDGRARLLDFGVARMRGGGVDYQTQVRSFVGKITYSAPEMFAGVEATPQSDLYSCGVVLHEMLLGRNVFSGKNQAATLNLVLNHTPEPVESLSPNIPAGLDNILRKSMAKNPEERFGSAHEFALALRSLQREYESELRARFAIMLKTDFGEDMARLLGLESLTARDEAWRRLSVPPPQVERTIAVDLDDALGQDSVAPQSQPGGRPRSYTLKGPAFAPEPGSASGITETARRRTGAHAIAPGARMTGAHAIPPLPNSQAYQRGSLPPPPPSFHQTGRMMTTGMHAAPEMGHPPQNKWLFLALGVVGALATVAIIVSFQGRTPEPAPVVPPIRVVAEQTAPPEPVVVAPEDPVDQAPEPTTRQTKVRKATEPDPAGLTKAFRRQQGKIEACFKQFTSQIQGTPQIQLEFDIDPTGKIVKVAASPAALAETALGKCLRDVGKQTRFPGQGQSVSFAIPITASRGATGG